ncbi:hypothetical protein HC864_01005 [Candidatus Gracilibacteria bacterium]|nr:hypothetical protein [Thermales bacterium]NJL96389.1 hypothetical protein [Candidatus Gracilibacteria bacterium]
MEIKTIVEDYVRNEFKLSTIWNVIYEMKVENKVTPEQIDLATKEVMDNPKKFGFAQNVEENQARDFAANTLKKQIAAQWLFGNLKDKDKK